MAAPSPSSVRTAPRAAPAIRRVIWRFTGDQDAALNLLLSHEADLLETVGDSARVARVVADSALGASSYPSAVYGFLGFNLAAEESSRGRGAPVAIPPFASAAVRRALAEATDRADRKSTRLNSSHGYI